MLEALEEALGDAYFFQRCTTADQALEALDLRPFSVAICDVNLPGQSGESVLAAVKSRWPGTEVIMVTGGRDLQTAVRCMRLGAYDYIPKPWHLEELRTVVARAAEKAGLVRENAMLRQGLPAPGSVELLGSSAAMHSLRQLIAKVAAHDNVVLITGESGTGKEMVARAIHAASVRRRERFVAIGCGSVPSDLVESELFGHERGAFSS
ncbi:MAG TPA: sigma 54-interacting transcriptional regulator, partial [bacterium]|nr:sigma 54-interacting transcriptional regulator [bacterium]